MRCLVEYAVGLSAACLTPDDTALRIRCGLGDAVLTQRHAVDVGQVPGDVHHVDRVLGGYFIEILTGEVPLVFNHGVIEPKAKHPVPTRCVFGKSSQLRKNSGDVEGLANGRAIEVRTNG